MVCVEPDTLCSSMSLCACVGKSSLMGGVRTVQRAQGLPIAIVEEIAYENGSRASSSWSPRNATARAPMSSI